MDERQNTLSRAQSAIISRDFSLAQKLLKSVLKENPKDAETLKMLGDMYIKSGDDEKALEIYKNVTVIERTDINNFITLGGIYRRLKMYEESAAVLENTIVYKNNDPEINYNLGFTYKLMGNYDSAITCFQNVIEEKEDDVLAYNHLGTIYAAKGDLLSATKTYLQGLKIDHNHPILHYNLAQAYEGLGKNEQALSSYEAALRAKPLWHDAIEKYSDLLLKTNNVIEAKNLVENAVRLTPESSKMQTQLGCVFMKESDWSSAQGVFGKAVTLDEKNTKAKRGLASSSENLGEYEKSAKIMEEVSKENPEDPEIIREYIGTLLSASYLDSAKTEIDALLEKEGDRPGVENLSVLAEYYVCRKNEKALENVLEQINKKAPEYSKVYRDIGKRSLQSGNAFAARKYIGKYLESNPDDAFALNEMGKVCESLFDLEGAMKYYNQALKHESYNVAVKKQLSNVEPKIIGNQAKADHIVESENFSGTSSDILDNGISFDSETPSESVLSELAEAELEDVELENLEEISEEPSLTVNYEAGEKEMPAAEKIEKINEEEIDLGNLSFDFPESESELKLDEIFEEPDELSQEPVTEELSEEPVEELSEELVTDELSQEPVAEEILENAEREEPALEEDFDKGFEESPLKEFEEAPVLEEDKNDKSAENSMDNSRFEQLEKELQEAKAQAEKAKNMAENAWFATESLADQIMAQEEILEEIQSEEKTEENASIEALPEDELSEESLSEDELSEESLSEDELSEEPLSEDELSEGTLPETEEKSISEEDAVAEIKNDLTNEELYEKYKGTLQVFKTLKNLCEFLPENKKEEFAQSHARLLMDYIIQKLSGIPGLYETTDTLVKSGVLKDVNQSENNDNNGRKNDNFENTFDLKRAENTLLNMEQYIDSLEDKNLAVAIKKSLNNFREKVKIATL